MPTQIGREHAPYARIFHIRGRNRDANQGITTFSVILPAKLLLLVYWKLQVKLYSLQYKNFSHTKLVILNESINILEIFIQ